MGYIALILLFNLPLKHLETGFKILPFSQFLKIDST